MIIEEEREVYLFKEPEPGKAGSGGRETRLVVSNAGKGPVLEATSTWGGVGGAAPLVAVSTEGSVSPSSSWGSTGEGTLRPTGFAPAQAQRPVPSPPSPPIMGPVPLSPARPVPPPPGPASVPPPSAAISSFASPAGAPPRPPARPAAPRAGGSPLSPPSSPSAPRPGSRPAPAQQPTHHLKAAATPPSRGSSPVLIAL
jgi:hypothetical protein